MAMSGRSAARLIFCGTSLADLRAFPVSARRKAGYQLEKVQNGLAPGDYRPMSTVGPGACEIRIHDENGIFRVIYLARHADAVCVLHCFQKKTQTTRKTDLDLARSRYKLLMKDPAP